MRLLLDSSVLIAAILEDHTAHDRARSTVDRALNRKDSGFVALHALAEVYSQLTGMPRHPRISPNLAIKAIEPIQEGCEVVEPAHGDFLELLTRAKTLNVLGAGIYDLLHVQAALKIKADRLVTLDLSDFRRLTGDCPFETCSPW